MRKRRRERGRFATDIPAAIECNCGLIDPDIAPGQEELAQCFTCSDGTHLLLADQAFGKWEDVHPEFRQWLIEETKFFREDERRNWLEEAKIDFKLLTQGFWQRKVHWSFDQLEKDGLSGRWCGAEK